MSYRVIRRILLRALLLVVLINTDSSQAQGAGPRLIIVTGGGLSKPIVLDNFQENLDLMRSISEDAGLTTKELAGRRYFELTFFSGPYWVRYIEEGKPLHAVRPESGDQRGRFYPAISNSPPIITYDVGLPRRVAPEGVAILRRHGIPVVVQAQNSIWLLAIYAALVLGLLLIITTRLIRRRGKLRL